MDPLCDRIREIMADNSLNQTKLGNALGINPANVSMWLSGRSKPSAQTIQHICDKMGNNRDWLLTGEGDPRSLATAEQQVVDVLSHAIGYQSTASDRFLRAVAAAVSAPNGEEILDATLEFLRRILDEYNAEHPPDGPK